MEEIFTFQNSNSEKLFGIAHIPEQHLYRDNRIGINLLNPGIKYRVAPNRLNVKIARILCDKGYFVFRFDPAGIGDSEGALPEGVAVQDIFEKIQTGMFVKDTIVANQYLEKKYNIDSFIMMGNCGGAITALFTGNIHPKVNAVCLIDIPINLRTSKMTFADKISEPGSRADYLLLQYFKRAINLKAWYRFLTFRTEYKALLKLLRIKVKKIFGGKYNTMPSDIEKLYKENNLNRMFFENINTYLQSNKKVLFLLAENDPGTEVFEDYFQNSFLNIKYKKYNRNFKIFTIPDANHIYSLASSQETLIRKICHWIDTLNLSTY